MFEFPESGKLLFFADLRVADRSGDLEPISAYVVCSFATKAHDWIGPIPQGVAVIGTPVTDETHWGPARDTVMYPLLELDDDGREIDDWACDTLDEALGHIEKYSPARWEELPQDRGQALELIRQRLSNPPRL